MYLIGGTIEVFSVHETLNGQESKVEYEFGSNCWGWMEYVVQTSLKSFLP